MKTTGIARAALGATLSLALACGTSGSSTPSNTGGDSLVGRWQSACTPMNAQQAFKLDFDIQSATWVLDYDVFGDTTCTTKFLTVRIEGPYETGNVSAPSGAREARFGFARKLITPHGEAASGFLASEQGCGATGFAAGVARDISTSGCAGLGQRPIAQCPADFDLVKRDGDGLRFGARPADNDMCTPDKRPTALAPVVSQRVR